MGAKSLQAGTADLPPCSNSVLTCRACLERTAAMNKRGILQVQIDHLRSRLVRLRSYESTRVESRHHRLQNSSQGRIGTQVPIEWAVRWLSIRTLLGFCF